MLHVRLPKAMTVASVLAATGCTGLTIVGWSGELGNETAQVTSPQRYPTAVSSLPGELLQPHLPSLGDIDGDGHDDFILVAQPLAAPGKSAAYLFYGRSSFPEHIDANASDATFVSGMPFAFPLGDINGDGLADFALGAVDGYEFIFGSAQRLSGNYEHFGAGIVWSRDEKAGENGSTELNQVVRLGDTNGDGYDDIALRVVESLAADGGSGVRLATDYMVTGRKEGWPSGTWDPSWAAAQLAPERIRGGSVYGTRTVLTSGDFDGDGCSDIIVRTYTGQLLFYGKHEGFHGALHSDQADAQLGFGQLGNLVSLGDLDGDGSADLASFQTNELQIFYGSKVRYAGAVQPRADLTFYDQGPYSNPVVGDFNDDGHQDLLFVANAEAKHWDNLPIAAMDTAVYQVHGTTERLTGHNQLASSDVYQPIGYPAPSTVSNAIGFTLNAGGDFDGDGSSDLIIGAPSQQSAADSVVLLLPGATRAPD